MFSRDFARGPTWPVHLIRTPLNYYTFSYTLRFDQIFSFSTMIRQKENAKYAYSKSFRFFVAIFLIITMEKSELQHKTVNLIRKRNLFCDTCCMIKGTQEMGGQGEHRPTQVLAYTPLQNVWHGSKSVVTFGLIKILSHPC